MAGLCPPGQVTFDESVLLESIAFFELGEEDLGGFDRHVLVVVLALRVEQAQQEVVLEDARDLLLVLLFSAESELFGFVFHLHFYLNFF